MEGNRINLVSKEAQIIESAGKRKFYLDLDEKPMEYEKRMLCSCECPYTLPMYFLSEEGTEKAYYDFTGFIQLKDYIKRDFDRDLTDRGNKNLINDALGVLAKILESIKGMESYLLFPERISTHHEAIFIHLSNGQAVFAFFPNEKPDETLESRIFELIDDLNELYHDVEAEQYLKKFKNLINMKNPGLDGMISILGTIQREVSYIYWNTEDFRTIEDKKNQTELKKSKFRDRRFVKPIAIQAVFGAGLLAVFLSGVMEFLSFAGLAILTAGADLWIMKKLLGAK